jgi:DUF1680 family protein
MKSPTIHESKITGGFWAEKLNLNSKKAIYYQWSQLEKTGCVDNFRICAGISDSFREGMFFSDSDGYKWLDAASRILATIKDLYLKKIVDEFIQLIDKAQDEDGYIYTYNQIHFPGTRWKNLQIEHELYCMGHLIEAGVSHHQATGEETLLNLVRKAADLILKDFWEADSRQVDGHEEVEIALLKLAQETGNNLYREMAKRFLERRKGGKGYGWEFVREAVSSVNRLHIVSVDKKIYLETHPDREKNKLPPRNLHKTPITIWPRLVQSLLSGKFSQRHATINDQVEPVGHAVRFAYLETAATMLANQTKDLSMIPTLEKVWEKLVSKRMYVTGGIGSIPHIEGFGRDYELDPEVAYTETCAALGCLFWNRELSLLTGNSRYDDLFEWQLYNAAAVGLGTDGCSYSYNNPLINHGEYQRAGWYDVPCCPSNISRTWAVLGTYIYSYDQKKIGIHQYITSEADLKTDSPVMLHMESGFPWNGDVRIILEMVSSTNLDIDLRIPSWVGSTEIWINEIPFQPGLIKDFQGDFQTASGVDLTSGRTQRISRIFDNGDDIKLKFQMPIKILKQDSRIRSCRGMAAISRGPVVYCLEGFDNPDLELTPGIDVLSLKETTGSGFFENIPLIEGTAINNCPVKFIPYMMLGNRGKSGMSVFFYPLKKK